MIFLWQAVEYIQQGGWVMFPLGLCSITMWALIAERLHAFHFLSHPDVAIPEAIRAVQENRPPAGGGLRTRLVRGFLAQRTGDPELDTEILQENALRLQPRLSRFLALISILAAIAPLLGLLGTVIGMITTFDVIALFGTGNARALASGISLALITTQSGLLVAIPGMLLGAALERRATRLEMRLEEILTVLQRQISMSQPAEGGS